MWIFLLNIQLKQNLSTYMHEDKIIKNVLALKYKQDTLREYINKANIGFEALISL